MNKDLILGLVENAKNAMPAGMTPAKWIEVYNEKLVELVMQECLDILNERKDSAIDMGWNVDEAMSCAAMHIQEHFGAIK